MRFNAPPPDLDFYLETIFFGSTQFAESGAPASVEELWP